jgi:protein-tyrosine phosphatase
VSLYPWESYRLGEEVEGALIVRLFDRGEIPDRDLLVGIATWVNVVRKLGPTLVHCQAGLNRSGLVAALALVLSGVKPADAIALLREKRCAAVLCNAAFESWLLEAWQ